MTSQTTSADEDSDSEVIRRDQKRRHSDMTNNWRNTHRKRSMTGSIKLRAVHAFDTKDMGYKEEMELGEMIVSRLMNKREKTEPTEILPDFKNALKEIAPKVELMTIQDNNQNIREDASGKNLFENQEATFKVKELKEVPREEQLITDQEDIETSDSGISAESEEMCPYPKALTFKRGDILETISPANIGDKVRWWMVRHLESGEIGFIPRNRVVIDEDRQPSKTTLNALPQELLDIVLQISYLSSILHYSPGQRDEDVIRALASVNFCWFQRIVGFKKIIRRWWKEVITLRAVYDFDPRKMRIREQKDFMDVAFSQRLVYKKAPRKILSHFMKVMKENTTKVELMPLENEDQSIREESSVIQNQPQAIKTEELEVATREKELNTDQENLHTPSLYRESTESNEVDPYAKALSFKRGDKMKAFPPANIGDKVKWWMVRHLKSGKIGFIPRNRVVIDEDHQPSKTTLNDLTLELLDIILQNSYLYWILHSSPDQRNEDVIRTLASVNFCWFQRIARRRFKKRIWRWWKEFYEKSNKSSAVIRNIQEFLLANIQPNYKLIVSLLSLNCITEKQSRFIQRKRLKRDKTAELLHVVRSFDKTKISNFINCLRKTNQKTVARIIENGGGVIKVEVQDRGSTFRETKQIHQAIKNLRERTIPRSHQTDKLISQLKEEGMEILNCQLDKQTAVVWIWCHSQTAIENIQKLYESNQLTKILYGFANTRPPTSEIIRSNLVNIDSNELKKTFVVFQIFINFNESLDEIDEKLNRIVGIAKLRNEIYILCDPYITSDPCFLRVFEDQNPFRLWRENQIQEIVCPKDITSSEKENCLYVADSNENCIWKIIIKAYGQNKLIKWLTLDHRPINRPFDYNKLPITMSVSSNGALLTVYYSLQILDVYGSGAELLHSIQLPSDSMEILNAVETSIGNFIILYKRKKKKAGESGSSRRDRTEEWGISELSRDGQMVIRHFIPSNKTEKLIYPSYLSIDADDWLFVADSWNRVILLNPDLKWNRKLCPTEEEKTMSNEVKRLYYDEEQKQLIVQQPSDVKVYTLNRI